MILFDTETCGFVGPLVLIQSKKDDGPINLFNVWKRPVRDTLNHIEKMMEEHLVAFNIGYDAFHLAKCYNAFRKLPLNREPEINAVFEAEKLAYDGLCLKPPKSTDLLLLLKEYQFPYLNDLKPIIIRRVPREMWKWMEVQLNTLRDKLNPLLFYNRSHGCHWHIDFHKNRKGIVDERFIDCKLETDATVALKPVISWLFGLNTIEYGIPRQHIPDEWCPFISGPRKVTHHYMPFGLKWREVIRYHIQFWNDRGVTYAEQDIHFLELLQRWMNGEINGNDESGKPRAKVQPRKLINIRDFYHRNSELAWQVGVCRQHGYPINEFRAKELLQETEQYKDVPIAPGASLAWLREVATPLQKMGLTKSDDPFLEEVEKTYDGEISNRAKQIRTARTMDKRRLILKRLLLVGRYHPDFFVLGTQTNRMSGSGGINPQGIDREIRDVFLFADEGYLLSGGDFDAQEVSIAATDYQDAILFEEIKDGFDIHGFAAKLLFDSEAICPDCQGKRCKDNKACDKGFIKSKRYIGKNGFVFPLFYGAEDSSIARKNNLPVERVRKAFQGMYSRYSGIKRTRDQLTKEYSALIQPESFGNVYWREPKQFITSMFGFSRSFETEYVIIRFLYELSKRIPREAYYTYRDRSTNELCFSPKPTGNDIERVDVTTRVERTSGRQQTISGATATALFGSSFGLQSRIVRVACNHRIQAAGAECTKELQISLWNLQPVGISEFLVQPFNVHDEIITPTKVPEECKQVVDDGLRRLNVSLPLVKMTWKTGFSNWSKK